MTNHNTIDNTVTNNSTYGNMITPETDLGNFSYPFLHGFENWELLTYKIAQHETMPASNNSTLVWVKDGKVMELKVYNEDGSVMDHLDYLDKVGLGMSMKKGGFVLSKRLSRIMRPLRYYGWFHENEVDICHGELDEALWDGCGRISRRLLIDVMKQCDHLTRRQRGELDLPTPSTWNHSPPPCHPPFVLAPPPGRSRAGATSSTQGLLLRNCWRARDSGPTPNTLSCARWGWTGATTARRARACGTRSRIRRLRDSTS